MEREGYRTDWLQESYLKGVAKGEARGEASGEARGEAREARRALVRVLAERGFALTAERQARIDAEKDLPRLERWHDVAITATSIAEVFNGARPDRDRRSDACRSSARRERSPSRR